MWKKIVPIAAVLLVAWIGLNLITSSDEAEDVDTVATNEADVNESDAEEVKASAEQDTDTSTDENVSAVATTSEAADVAPEADSDVVADVAASVETASEDAAGDEAASIEMASEETTDEDTASTESPSDASVEEESVAVTDPESTSETATTSSVDATTATDTSDTGTQAIVEMRYPTDPVTGLTIYDQGRVEVVIEPTVEPTPESAETNVDIEAIANESSDENAPANDELAMNDDGAANSETSPEIVMEMRYPTDPVTGLTIYSDGKVEVPVEVTDYWPTVEAPQETDSSDMAASIEGRLPVDPVTGATIYPSEASASTSDIDTATEETANEGNRLPVDPVTGATIYADASSVGETDTDTGQTADVESQRLPFDPVTGATIYPDAETDISAESVVAVEAESAEADSERVPVDPVTGASLHDTADAENATDSASTESAETTTTSLAVKEERVDISGISRQIGGVFGATSAVLGRSTDEATAMASLPRLETASASLVEVTDQFQSLPDSSASVLGHVVRRNMATLMPLADTVLVKPGVSEVLLPVLQPMMDQLSAMAEQ